MQCKKIAPLLDHLVGEHLHRVRDSEAECIGGLEIDNEFKLR